MDDPSHQHATGRPGEPDQPASDRNDVSIDRPVDQTSDRPARDPAEGPARDASSTFDQPDRTGADALIHPETSGPETSGDAPPSEEHTIETTGPQRLDPAYITVERIGNWIFAAFVALGSAVFIILAFTLDWFEPGFRIWLVPIGAGATAFFGFLAEWYPRRVYRWTRYVVDDQFLEIARGRLFRKVITVPRSRVQHTDVVDGPVLRRFGLANLNIYTAGTQHAMVQLRGLSRTDANRIRDGLIGRRS